MSDRTLNDIKKYEPLWNAWYVESLLGQGAFSKVYKVYRESFGKTIYSAVKIISIPQDENEIRLMKREGLDEASMRLFFHDMAKEIVNEVDLISQFRGNSHIVNIEDYQIIEKATSLTSELGWDILIRMEILKSLSDHMTNNPLPEEEAIKLGIHMCRALELCALKNIIHRDIKPDNIFVSPYGDYKLGDFGVARQMDRTSAEMSRKGTYSYMAPEVFRNEPYGASVDIYSLGIVMYSILNRNRPPFLPEYPLPILPGDRDLAMQKRLSGEPVPSLKPRRGGRDEEDQPGTNPELGRLVLKACAFKPKERFASPREMRESLEQLAIDTTATQSANRLLTIDKEECRSGAAQRMDHSTHEGGMADARTSTDACQGSGINSADIAASSSPPWWKPRFRPVPFQTDTVEEVHINTDDRVEDVSDDVKDGDTREDAAIAKEVSKVKPRAKTRDKTKSGIKGKEAAKDLHCSDGDSRLNIDAQTTSPTKTSPILPARIKPNSWRKRMPLWIGLTTLAASLLVLVVVLSLQGWGRTTDPIVIQELSGQTIEMNPESEPETETEAEAEPETEPDSQVEPGFKTGSEPEQDPVPPIGAPVFQDLRRKEMTNEQLVALIRSGDIPPNIISLNLSHNKITDISSLRSLKELKYLDLQYNDPGITDFSPLTSMPDLLELGISGNNVSDLTFLKSLPNLRSINLNASKITTNHLKSLNSLPKLTKLAVNANELRDISPLASLTGLTELSLEWNYIQDITPLKSLKNLKSLSIVNNKIGNNPSLTQEQIDDLRRAVPGCDIKWP
ncbi:MAG: protein kinase [Peptococcaceae bacterium]|nr:protein kinase [Peptococcaceae bacterium]